MKVHPFQICGIRCVNLHPYAVDKIAVRAVWTAAPKKEAEEEKSGAAAAAAAMTAGGTR